MHKVTLQKGLTVGEKTYKEAVLRELSAGDIMAAMEESERVVMTPTSNGVEPVLLLSNALMGINTLRRQIASLGEIQGPLEREQMNLLSDVDLGLLQQGVAELDLAVAKDIGDRGRS